MAKTHDFEDNVFGLTHPRGVEPGSSSETERREVVAHGSGSGVDGADLAELELGIGGAAVEPDGGAALDAADYSTDERVDVREALGFPVVLWPKLPVSVTLHCSQAGAGFAITTSKAGYGAALDAGVPVFVGGELKCLAIAVEVGRFRASDFRDALQRKRERPATRITPDIAFAGWIPVDANACKLAMGGVFDALGIYVERVELHE